MATPITADDLVRRLKEEGVRVVEVRSWRTHNRNHMGAWGPVHGVVVHHTVTSGTAETVGICYDGYSSLPGPLCHGVIGKDGVVYLVGHGRANHAGSGDGDVLNAVINETALPADNEANTDGNRYFYGFECENLGDGADPWPAVQLDAIERAAAALCRHHGWSERSVIGHLEWQPGKIDPRGFTMDAMRTCVAERLAHEPGWSRDGSTPTPEPTPEPTTPARYQVTINGLVYGYGASGDHVLQVDQALIARGFNRHHDGDGYQAGTLWTDYTTFNYADFQRSLGYSGSDADGVPGESSLRQLLGTLPSAPSSGGTTTLVAPAFPGREHFVLGARNKHAKRLQTWLHKGGWGPKYTVGPSETMTAKDLEKVRALQRRYIKALGPADGAVGPKTWRYAWEVAHGLRKK